MGFRDHKVFAQGDKFANTLFGSLLHYFKLVNISFGFLETLLEVIIVYEHFTSN